MGWKLYRRIIMSREKIAQGLLDVAEAFERQTAEVTSFACNKCGHTTTLARINDVRSKVASEAASNIVVDTITVNDKVSCPAPDCGGILAYSETETSKEYYYDEKSAGDECGPEDAEKDEKKDEEPIAKKKADGENCDMDKNEKKDEEPVAKKKKASINYDSLDRYIKN
jgi:hypothetical protein